MPKKIREYNTVPEEGAVKVPERVYSIKMPLWIVDRVDEFTRDENIDGRSATVMALVVLGLESIGYLDPDESSRVMIPRSTVLRPRDLNLASGTRYSDERRD